MEVAAEAASVDGAEVEVAEADAEDDGGHGLLLPGGKGKTAS